MNATDKTYNGWQNYETWNVNLWMEQDRSLYEFWNETAREFWERSESEMAEHTHWTRSECARFTLADFLKDHYESASANMLEAAKQEASVWADLLGAALSEVDWQEIADSWLARLELDGYESSK